jgi:glycosyltransferase involved in cell wall biosynthesis
MQRHHEMAFAQRQPANMIVMLTCQFTEILGGAEKQCHSLSETLRQQGLNVVVLTSRLPGSLPLNEPFVQRFWTYAPPQLAGRYLPASIIWGLQALFWIWRHRRRIAILHCHQLRINAYVAAIANALLGIPTLMKPGVGGDLNDFNVVGQWKYGLGRRGAKFVAKRSTAVVATASQIACDARSWGIPENRIFRIPNGVRMEALGRVEIGPHDIRAETAGHRLRFAFVGRLSEEKRARVLLAAALALGPGPEIELNFFGDGPLRRELEAEARKSTNDSVSVVFHGRVEEVAKHLAEMNFLMLVSSSEGLSNALLEAACAGVVPILSNVSGSRDVVPWSEYPLRLRNAEMREVVIAIDRARNMSKADWLYWSERISRRARAKFDIVDVAKKYVALYRHLAQLG